MPECWLAKQYKNKEVLGSHLLLLSRDYISDVFIKVENNIILKKNLKKNPKRNQTKPKKPPPQKPKKQTTTPKLIINTKSFWFSTLK